MAPIQTSAGRDLWFAPQTEEAPNATRTEFRPRSYATAVTTTAMR